MAGNVTLAGLMLTEEEWEILQPELLQAFVASSPERADEGAYESYELIYDADAADAAA